MPFKFRWLLNTVLTFSLSTLAVSGAAIYFKFWFDGISELHEISSCIFIAASLIHFGVNWKAFRLGLKDKWIAAAGVLVVLAVILLIPHKFEAKTTPQQSALSSEDISLPAPHQDGGKPLMQALKERRSARTFQNRPLPAQMISDLMWAACGINRTDSGRRTAPSARNMQEIEIYAVTAVGAYLYDPKFNKLRAISKGDLRKSTGINNFAATAPLVLVYVADKSKAKTLSAADWRFYSAIDAGFISQNVYLFSASEGLSTVVLGGVDRKALANVLMLPPEKDVIVTQPIGYTVQQ